MEFVSCQFKKVRQAQPDPEMANIVAESRSAAGLLNAKAKPPRFTDQDIVECIFFPVVNEVRTSLFAIHSECLCS